MEIKVKNCGNCPFFTYEIDYDAVGADTVERCNLANFFKLKENIIDVYNSYEHDISCEYCNNWDLDDDEYNESKCTCKELHESMEIIDTTPKWCPLRTNKNINVIQE